MIQKRFTILFIVVAFVIGGALGFGIGKGSQVSQASHQPVSSSGQVQEKTAASTNPELAKMARSGDVISVKPYEVTIKITYSGDEQFKGKTITVLTDKSTSFQEGTKLLDHSSGPVDLTKYLKPGMKIDFLVKGNTALAIHWPNKK